MAPIFFAHTCVSDYSVYVAVAITVSIVKRLRLALLLDRTHTFGVEGDVVVVDIEGVRRRSP
jgi:hypothetical protein